MPSSAEHGDAEREPTLMTSATEHAAMIEAGLARFGEPFIAYLVADGVEQRSSHLLEEFEASYVGHYPDRFSFILSLAGYPNYEGGIGLFIERLGLPADAEYWDHSELWAHLCEQYRITERLGGVYVFRR